MVTRRRWWIAPSLRLGLLAVVAAAVLTIGSTLASASRRRQRCASRRGHFHQPQRRVEQRRSGPAA